MPAINGNPISGTSGGLATVKPTSPRTFPTLPSTANPRAIIATTHGMPVWGEGGHPGGGGAGLGTVTHWQARHPGIYLGTDLFNRVLANRKG